MNNKKNPKIKLKKLIFFTSAVIMIATVGFVVFTKNKIVEAGWWNESWAYRQSVMVTNNTTPEIDVYVSLNIDTASTTLFQSDCGDLRFTTTNGEVLPYYIVSGCGTATTNVHVNFPIFESGAQDLYYYYGNASVENGFNATDFATVASDYTIGTPNAMENSPSSSIAVSLGNATTTGAAPVLHLKMDEKVSGDAKTLYDISGNGNNATTVDGANNTGMDCTMRGKYGSACEFDGVDDYAGITQSASLNNLTSLTYSAWVKAVEDDTSWNSIIEKGSGSSWRRTMYLGESSGGSPRRITFALDTDGTDAKSISANNSYTVGQWEYWTATYDDSGDRKVRIYKNGQEVAYALQTAGTGSLIDDSTLNVALGATPSTQFHKFTGQIDDVRIYNYARTQKQIIEDMHNGKPLDGARVNLDFDEGYGATANDKTDASLNATLYPVTGGANTTATQMWSLNGHSGKAIELDGTDDYVSVPDFGY